MRVSKTFLRHFAYLANLYQWTPEVIVEIKDQTRRDPRLLRYWRNLAIAHRCGYEQTAANGWMRLDQWCAKRGWPNPYDADLAEVV